MNKYILPLWGCWSCRFCSLCRLGHAVDEKNIVCQWQMFWMQDFRFWISEDCKGGCWQEESKWPIHRSLSVMSSCISLQTSTSTQPFNSHFLTSVPSSMRWERKERQHSLTCPCCVALHWCCGWLHDILCLLRFLPSTSFHQRGLAGNCLAECCQRLESKTWSGCVTEVTSDRPRPCFRAQLSVW